MSGSDSTEIPRLLSQLVASPSDRTAEDQLFAAVYQELRTRADRRLRGNEHASWSATDLVHATYLKMAGGQGATPRTRTRFLAIASHAMRQVFIDYLRAKTAAKRGGDRRKVTLTGMAASGATVDVDLIDLEAALTELDTLDARMSRIVQLRFFGDLSMEEIASELGVTRRTVQRDWRVARSWLLRRMSGKET